MYVPTSFRGVYGSRITEKERNEMLKKNCIILCLLTVVVTISAVRCIDWIRDGAILFTIPDSFGISLKQGRTIFGWRHERDILYLEDEKGLRSTIHLEKPIPLYQMDLNEAIIASTNRRFVAFISGPNVMRGEFTSDENWISGFRLIPIFSDQDLISLFPEKERPHLIMVLSISDDGEKIIALMMYYEKSERKSFSDLVLLDVVEQKGRYITADQIQILDNLDKASGLSHLRRFAGHPPAEGNFEIDRMSES
jgi:hypothetical protein